jgi:hypothetical protein
MTRSSPKPVWSGLSEVSGSSPIRLTVVRGAERIAERVAGIGAWDEEHEPARVPDVSYDDLGLAGVPLPLERDLVAGLLACVEFNKHLPAPFLLRSSHLPEVGSGT